MSARPTSASTRGVMPGRPKPPTSRFSRTVSASKSEGLWNFRQTPPRAMAACEARVSSSCPSSSAELARARVRPETTSSSVVLPAPFGPISARISP